MQCLRFVCRVHFAAAAAALFSERVLLHDSRATPSPQLAALPLHCYEHSRQQEPHGVEGVYLDDDDDDPYSSDMMV